MRISLPRSVLVSALLATPWVSSATGAEVPGPVPGVHALVGARVVVAPGRVLEGATVVVRDGLVEAVGAEVGPPADAQRHELDGVTLYPGLIEPYSARPWPDEGEASPDVGHANPQVRPERDMALHARDAAADEALRAAGFTTALVVPEGGVFRGWAALVNLGDGPLADDLLRRGVAQVAGFRAVGEEGGYPQSLMGAVTLFRQTLLDASWHRRARAAYAARPAQPRPPLSPALAALEPVAAAAEPIVLETGDAQGSLRAAALAGELGLDAWLLGNGEEHRWLDGIAAAGLPVLLPLDFPAAPKVAEEDDLTVGLAELRAWEAAPENPGRLLEAGVTVAFTSHGLAAPRDLHESVARALERGLGADAALAALTTVPAGLLGIGDRAGTIEAGRMANLVEVEGELFVAEPRVRAVWIDGRRHPVDAAEPPEVDAAGTWSLRVTTGDGQVIPAELTVAGPPAAMEGELSAMGQTIPLSAARVSGDALEARFDGASLGMPGTIRLRLEIAGDRASGGGTAPGGKFTLEARRTAPAPEAAR